MDMQTVLLVDDHPLMRSALRHILEGIREDLVINVASSLEEASRIIKSTDQPLLTVLDLQLPDASGTATLDTLLRRHPGLTLIAMSDRPDQALSNACRNHGALGFMLKTASVQQVSQCLQQALERALTMRGHRSTSVSMTSAAPAPTDSVQLYMPAPTPAATPAEADGFSTTPAMPAREYRDGRHLGLTERQRSVLKFIMLGLSNKAICRELHLAEGTIKVHVSAVLRALGVGSRSQVTMAALRSGIRVEDIIVKR